MSALASARSAMRAQRTAVLRRWNSTAAGAQAPPQAATSAAASGSATQAGAASGASPAAAATAGAAGGAPTVGGPVLSSGRRPARHRRVMIGLGIFAGCGFLFPFYLYMTNTSHHYSGSKALTPAQRIRGAYINSSTRDIGPDPEWQKRFEFERVEDPKRKQ